LKYLHIDNKDKPFVDWRNPTKRLEGFLRWLKWRMRWCDLDHYVCNNAYRDADGHMSPTGKPMTKEQTYWFSLIFGMTYQSEMAWVIYWHFPNLWDINFAELDEWNRSTIEIQKYAKDTKYNKGRIVEQVKSIVRVIGPYGSVENFFKERIVDNEHNSFENVFNLCMSLHKYGRMCSWITCQTLYETAGLPIRPANVLATDPSCWSVRSGLLYVYGKDEMIEKSDKKTHFTEDDLSFIKRKELELFDKSLDYIDEECRNIYSNYLLESHLCQYKKLMLGGDYAGHSSGDHVSRAIWLKERWDNVNFDAFFINAVAKHCPLVRNKRESKQLRDLCVKTGQMINMHNDFDDMPDMYKELNITPDMFLAHGVYEEIVKKSIDFYVNKVYNNANSLEEIF
jgi:hypothetical protein